MTNKFVIQGARNNPRYAVPPQILNEGFGDGKPRRPAVIALDRERQRIIFGVVRNNKESLDTEESLTDYNVYLDHNADKGEHASVLYVAMPSSLVQEFNSIITHYIHREYWHRIVPVACK